MWRYCLSGHVDSFRTVVTITRLHPEVTGRSTAISSCTCSAKCAGAPPSSDILVIPRLYYSETGRRAETGNYLGTIISRMQINPRSWSTAAKRETARYSIVSACSVLLYGLVAKNTIILIAKAAAMTLICFYLILVEWHSVFRLDIVILNSTFPCTLLVGFWFLL